MMKKFFGVAVLSLFATFAVQAQDLKFAHINTDEIIQLLPEYDSALVILEDFQVELVNTLELMQVELNNLAEAYNKDMNNLTETVRQVKEQELNDKNTRIQEFQTYAQEQLTNKQNELIQPMYLKVQSAIDAVGKENGFVYIFESTYIRYINATTSTDALPLVKAKLGIN